VEGVLIAEWNYITTKNTVNMCSLFIFLYQHNNMLALDMSTCGNALQEVPRNMSPRLCSSPSFRKKQAGSAGNASRLSVETRNILRVFHGFPQPLQENVGIA
jgi:hypothetical protein